MFDKSLVSKEVDRKYLGGGSKWAVLKEGVDKNEKRPAPRRNRPLCWLVLIRDTTTYGMPSEGNVGQATTNFERVLSSVQIWAVF